MESVSYLVHQRQSATHHNCPRASSRTLTASSSLWEAQAPLDNSPAAYNQHLRYRKTRFLLAHRQPTDAYYPLNSKKNMVKGLGWRWGQRRLIYLDIGEDVTLAVRWVRTRITSSYACVSPGKNTLRNVFNSYTLLSVNYYLDSFWDLFNFH